MTFAPTILDKPLPRFFTGWPRAPWAIIVHYSAGYNAEGCHNTLEKRGLSVHATIERDGVIWRQVGDENRSIHAGSGRWCGVSNMNHHAFGFEIANLGPLDGVFDGKSPIFVFDPAKRKTEEINPLSDGNVYYRDESGVRILTRTRCETFPDHRGEVQGKLWSVYPEEQLEAVFWLMWQWVRDHKILPENVIGHEHVTPGRKQDPGPHFPWRQWEAYLEAKCKAELPELLNPLHRKQERVKAVQSHCARMGLPVGDIDGLWGPNTGRAVRDAVSQYGAFYGFSEVVVEDTNCYALANALRLVPGFDPGRN